MAFAVTRRTREIGLRLAIGATRADVVRMVLADSVRLLVVGMAAGLCIAWFVTRPLAAFLVPGVTPTDPITFALVVRRDVGDRRRRHLGTGPPSRRDRSDGVAAGRIAAVRQPGSPRLCRLAQVQPSPIARRQLDRNRERLKLLEHCLEMRLIGVAHERDIGSRRGECRE